MSVVITGVKELDAKLKRLSTKTAKKAARAGLGAGLTVLAKKMRQMAPKATTPGHSNRSIKASIGKRQKKDKVTGITSAVAGIDVGKKKSKQVPQAHLLALGTVVRTRKSVGGKFKGSENKGTGKVIGNDFIKRASDAARSEAVSAILAKANEVIQREAAKN